MHQDLISSYPWSPKPTEQFCVFLKFVYVGLYLCVYMCMEAKERESDRKTEHLGEKMFKRPLDNRSLPNEIILYCESKNLAVIQFEENIRLALNWESSHL